MCPDGDAPAPTPPDGPGVPAGDVRDRWETNAAWWDATVGEGNRTQREIVGPATERLLGPVQGLRVLDLACGNGHFARRLADLGAIVTAVDFSPTFLALARARSAGYADRVRFEEVDLTAGAAVRGIAGGPFGAAVCTMALMDIADPAPLLSALPSLLAPGAPFVFSVTHPIFNHPGATKGLEETDGPEGLEERRYLRIDRYRSGGAALGTGIVGQPVAHWYFERTLTEQLAPLFRAGFVLDALEELGSPTGLASDRPLSWARFSEIPPFLIGRARAAVRAESP